MNRSRHIPGFLLLAGYALTIILYQAGLHGPFVHDDFFNLRPALSWAAGTTDFFEALFGNVSGPIGRPVSVLTFLFSASYGSDPYAFKLGNLFIHLACSYLVYLVSRMVFRQLGSYSRDTASLAAAILAVVWLLHPLNVSTVLYAVQRMTQLAALFSLASIACFLKAIEIYPTNRARAFDLALVAFPLLLTIGLLSKENAAVTPLLCLVLWVAIPADRRPAAALVKILVALAALGAVAAAILGGTHFPESLLAGYQSRDYSLWERLLTESRVLLDYIGQLLFPRPHGMGVFHDDYVKSTGLLQPATTAVSIALLAAISGVAVIKRNTYPIVAGGWFFFLAAHSIESSVLPLDLYYEHRNYLPMVGLLLAIVDLVHRLISRPAFSAQRRSIIAVGTVCVIAALSYSTHRAVSLWTSSDVLLANAVDAHPDSLRARIAEVLDRFDRGDQRGAIERLAELKKSGDPEQARISTIFDIALRCRMDENVSKNALADIAENAPERLTRSELHSLSFLVQSSSKGACKGIEEVQIGTTIAELADRATDQLDTNIIKSQVRFQAAMIFARLNAWQDALPQAELAWIGGPSLDSGTLYAHALHMNGRTEDAKKIAAVLRDRLSRWDRSGKMRVNGLDALLDPSLAIHVTFQ